MSDSTLVTGQYTTTLETQTRIEALLNINMWNTKAHVASRHPSEILPFTKVADSRVPIVFQFHDVLQGIVKLDSGATTTVTSGGFNYSGLFFLDVSKLYSRDEVQRGSFWRTDRIKDIREKMDESGCELVATWRNSAHLIPYDPAKDQLIYSRDLSSSLP